MLREQREHVELAIRQAHFLATDERLPCGHVDHQISGVDTGVLVAPLTAPQQSGDACRGL
ncbi:MAG: hypothetical protein ABIQ73_09380 [Acidimicrobiales bacterium]